MATATCDSSVPVIRPVSIRLSVASATPESFESSASVSLACWRSARILVPRAFVGEVVIGPLVASRGRAVKDICRFGILGDRLM